MAERNSGDPQSQSRQLSEAGGTGGNGRVHDPAVTDALAQHGEGTGTAVNGARPVPRPGQVYACEKLPGWHLRILHVDHDDERVRIRPEGANGAGKRELWIALPRFGVEGGWRRFA